jgi:hypothetical protein
MSLFFEVRPVGRHGKIALNASAIKKRRSLFYIYEPLVTKWHMRHLSVRPIKSAQLRLDDGGGF